MLFDGFPNDFNLTDVQMLLIEVPCNCPLAHGDTATIGFWHNQNGQKVINNFNCGGSAGTSTLLGTWLATQFPCLFGTPPYNLNGQPNSVVASTFLYYLSSAGSPKTYAQVMAGALACYATSSTLAGPCNIAGGYGFNISNTGTGAKLINVGSNGTAIGLQNDTQYTVLQLLQQANQLLNCSGGVILPGAFNALNDIFDSINQDGDIGG
jgi:hypothetical protein